jgi:hypothetical protein
LATRLPIAPSCRKVTRGGAVEPARRSLDAVRPSHPFVGPLGINPEAISKLTRTGLLRAAELTPGLSAIVASETAPVPVSSLRPWSDQRNGCDALQKKAERAGRERGAALQGRLGWKTPPHSDIVERLNATGGTGGFALEPLLGPKVTKRGRATSSALVTISSS